MKTFCTIFSFIALTFFISFNLSADNPKNQLGDYSKTTVFSERPSTQMILERNGSQETDLIPIYTDDFDGANDSVALEGRGYLIYRNGTSSGSALTTTWFQGIPVVFPAFNGPGSGYVASNYQTAGSGGDIDNWLVLPSLPVVLTGDSICFYSRSPEGSTYPDSIRVMYNPLGNTVPSDPGWTELGRFKVNTAGLWELRGFMAPGSGTNARFAIRYSVVDAGLFGNNSDFIGIDALVVKRDEPLPVELMSFVSSITNNDVTLNWITSSEINNSGFDIERSSSNGTWSKIGFVSGNGSTINQSSYSFTDRGLSAGTYNYRLKQIDFNGNYEYFNLGNEVIIGAPGNYELSQNFPNPFNPSTVINYQIPKSGFVKLSIYDMSGKELKSLVNENKEAGYYSVSFDGSGLSSGIYFYTINSGGFTETKKMMLVK